MVSYKISGILAHILSYSGFEKNYISFISRKANDKWENP